VVLGHRRKKVFHAHMCRRTARSILTISLTFLDIVISMTAVFAEFEREILRERVRAGLDHARQQGKRLGRPPSVVHKVGAVQKLYRQGISKSEIARRLEIGRTSVRRLLAPKKS
jgi:DNA invertase Pin-like site-specific DNA recombinase